MKFRPTRLQPPIPCRPGPKSRGRNEIRQSDEICDFLGLRMLVDACRIANLVDDAVDMTTIRSEITIASA